MNPDEIAAWDVEAVLNEILYRGFSLVGNPGGLIELRRNYDDELVATGSTIGLILRRLIAKGLPPTMFADTPRHPAQGFTAQP
jgi:hypothetical protein